MISDVLSDALAEIEEFQQDIPNAYAEVAAKVGVVKVVMEALRIVLDAAPGQPQGFNTALDDLRASIRAVDVSGLVAARDRLLECVRVRLPQDAGQDDFASAVGHWQHLGAVTVDTARLLLVDPIHQGRIDAWAEDGQIAIPGGDYSAVQVPTGIGDGRYRVEGRVIESPLLGRRLAEIRVRFLDPHGNWLGGDAPASAAEREDRQ